MKLVPVLLALFLATIAGPSAIVAADTEPNRGQEIIKLKMGDLFLIFPHWEHQKWTNNECQLCHEAQDRKFKLWDKEIAHLMCISCHDQKKKGPVACKDCHGTAYSSVR